MYYVYIDNDYIVHLVCDEDGIDIEMTLLHAESLIQVLRDAIDDARKDLS